MSEPKPVSEFDHPEHAWKWTALELDWIAKRDAAWRTTIATLRAEVEGLRAHAKKCDEWMEEAVEYVNRQMRSPSLEREGRDLRCRYAAIDAAKADKEGA